MTNARLTQAVAEVVVAPSSGKARLTQVAAEIVIKPTSSHGRLSQAVAEVVYGVAHARVDLAFDASISNTVGASLTINYSLAAPATAIIPIYDAYTYGKPAYHASLVDPEVYGQSVFLESVGQQLGIDYTIKAAVGKSLTPDYAIDGTTAGTLTIDAAIRDTVGAQRSIDYIIKDLGTKDLALDYAIDVLAADQVGADLGFEYAIGTAGGAHRDLAFSYRVTKATKIQQRGANIAFTYQILRKTSVGKDLLFKYRVIEPTHVGKSLAFHYAITANTVAGAGLGITYAIQKNTVVGASLGFAYQILPIPTQAGKNLSFTYEVAVIPPVVVAGVDLPFDDAISINVIAGANLAFDDAISVNALAGSDLPFDFGVSINNLVGSDLGIDYAEDVKTSVGQDLDLDYVVDFKSEVGVDLDLDAEVDLSTPRSDLDIDYSTELATPSAELLLDVAVSGLVGSQLGLDFTIEEVVPPSADVDDAGPGVIVVGGRRDWLDERAEEARARRRPFATGSSLTIDAPRRESVRSSLVFLLERRQLVAAGLRLDAPVANLLFKDLMIDHERFDMYDQNAALLLEEMDPDIAAMYDARNRVA